MILELVSEVRTITREIVPGWTQAYHEVDVRLDCGHVATRQFGGDVPPTPEALVAQLDQQQRWCGTCVNQARNEQLRQDEAAALARGLVYSPHAGSYTTPELAEQFAAMAAARLAPIEPAPRQSRTTAQRCAVCGAPAELAASLGPACPEHYDELS